MRKQISIVCGLMITCAMFLSAQTTLTESFESGTPTSAPSSPTSAELSSGTWIFYKAARSSTKNSGVYGVSLSSSSSDPGYVITPPFSTIGTLTLYARAGGSGKTITIQKSVWGGPFTTIATPTLTSSYALYTIAINDTAKNIRIKIMNTPGSGTTEYIDDVSITTLSKSVISVSTTALPNFGVVEIGATSTVATYSVSAVGLEQPLRINSSSGYEISTDNVSFGSTLLIHPSVTDSSIAETVVYVRFKPTIASGTTQGTITHTSGSAITRTVSLSGTAIAHEPTKPSMIVVSDVTGTSMSINLLGGDGEGCIVIMRAGEGTSWLPLDGVSISGVNSNFAQAVDKGDGNKVVLAGTERNVTVTGLAAGTLYAISVIEYNGTAPNAQNYLLSNYTTVLQSTLRIAGVTVTPSVLLFGSVPIRSIAERTYLLSGRFLDVAQSPITISAPDGFEVSLSKEEGYTKLLSIPITSEVLPTTTIYVRFLPSERKSYSGSLVHRGAGIQECTLQVSGNGVDSTDLTAQAIYIAPDGNDVTGDGSITNPFFSLQKAVDIVKPGGTIYMRGGVYRYTSRVNIKTVGRPDAYIRLWSMPGERAILDFSSMADADANQGIRLTGSYWHFYGFDVKGAGDNGLLIERDKPAGGKYNSIKDSVHQAHHNIIEYCNFYENRDSGIQLKNLAAHNRIINCDSYFNRDASDGDADGFAPKLTVGDSNYFYGCRAWQNSDDGFDMYLKALEDGFPDDMTTIIENCWVFSNGYLKDGNPSKGNGNGFKLGGSSNKDQRHNVILRRCLAFENLQKGFDQNGNMGNMTLINCSGFARPYLANSSHFTYRIDGTSLPPGKQLVYVNCVAVWDGISDRKKSRWAPCEMIGGISITNNMTTDSIDYLSIDTVGVRGPRKPDGSLPDIRFMQIRPGNSKLIDKGTPWDGIVYEGAAPDLGAFETSAVSDVTLRYESVLTGFMLEQNYPNPFNPSTHMKFTVDECKHTTLKVYNILGKEVATLFEGIAEPGRQYTIAFHATTLSSGVYIYILQSGHERIVRRMILMK
ncbi:MAG: right-handed parallel beta-helix repeat-containing protein [Bacteroidetes bacterium]|nr:right-handed parallel beta-helix repeat-containing protein [Bacteroidota bacterium]